MGELLRGIVLIKMICLNDFIFDNLLTQYTKSGLVKTVTFFNIKSNNNRIAVLGILKRE